MNTRVLIIGLALIAALSFLVGCHTVTPEPVVVTKEVLVPVPTKCKVDRPARPVEGLLALPTEATFYNKGNNAIKELEQWRAYSKLMDKAFDACSEPPGVKP